MPLIGYLLSTAISIYIYIIIIQVAIGWLVAFDVINSSNSKAQNLIKLLRRATDPVYERLNKFVPPIGGLDLTPLIVIIGLQVIHGMLVPLFY